MVYLGVITVAAGADKNNQSTAAPFTIPSSLKHLYLESDTDGVQFEIGSGASFVTTAARGAFLYDAKTANTQQGPYTHYNHNGSRIVAIHNPTSGSANVRVFGSLGV